MKLKLNTTLICLALIASVIISGCIKTYGPLNNGQRFLVKTYTAPNMIGIYTTYSISYTYDNLGRVVNSSDGYTYTYISGMVLISLNGTIYDTLILNNQGLDVRRKPGNEFYSYDGNGFLIRDSINYSLSIFTNDYLISDENIISQNGKNISLPNNNVSIENYSYTYYSDLDPRSYGTPFYGTQSKNLIKTQTSSAGWVCTYTYTYDGLGRVTQERRAYTGNTSSTPQYYTFTY